MTPIQASCLLYARDLIRDNCLPSITEALKFIVIYHPEWRGQCESLESYINVSLGYVSLNQWQKQRGMHFTRKENMKNQLDWIDWMLGRI